MAPQLVFKSTTLKEAGSGTKKTSSGTKEAISGTVKEQVGKACQPADMIGLVQSYTGLLSCNGDFDLPFKRQNLATPSDTWSTEAQVDKNSPKYQGSYEFEEKGDEVLADRRKAFVALEEEEGGW